MANKISLTLVVVLFLTAISINNQTFFTTSASSDEAFNPFASTPLDNDTIEQSQSYTLTWDVNDTARTGEKYNYILFDDLNAVQSSGEAGANARWINYNIPIDSTPGLHKYLMWINYTDSSSQWQEYTDQVWIDIVESEAPVFITQPESTISYQEGVTGNIIEWSASDMTENTYTIYRNGTAENGHNGVAWVSEEIISLNIDGYDVNTTTNITIVYTDLVGLQSNHTVLVSVVPNIAPVVLDSPDIVNYQYGSTGHSIDLTVSDEDLSHYEIFIGEDQFSTGLIEEDGIISASIDGLLLGSYHFEIRIHDGFGNIQITTTEVNVVDTEIPYIMSYPADLTYTYGEVGNQLMYQVNDVLPDYFQLYRNGTTILQSGWTSGEPFIINVDGYGVGTHNVTIEFYDTEGNLISDQVYIIVLPISTSVPEMNLTPFIGTGSTETLTGTWACLSSPCDIIDGSVDIRLVSNDGKVISSDGFVIENNGDYSIDFDYNSIIPGSYNWEIVFTGTGLESQNLISEVHVLSQPVNLRMNYPHTLEQGKEYTITVLVEISNNSSSSLGLNSVTSPSGPISGLNISLILKYIDVNGRPQSWSASQFSDESGSASFTLFGYETQNIVEITGIETSTSSPYAISDPVAASQDQFPEIDRTNGSGSTLDILGEYQIYVYGVSAVVFLLLSTGAVYIITRKPKMDEIDYFNQLQSLRAVILYNKDGIPIVDLNLGNFSTSTTLVAGLSSAITNFLDEISGSGRGELYTMEKSNLFVLSHKMEDSALAVISTFPYSDVFKKKLITIHNEMRSELPDDIFHLSFSQSDERVVKQTLDIFTQNALNIRLLCPYTPNYDNLRKTNERNLPKIVNHYYDILINTENTIGGLRPIDHWLDRFNDFKISRKEAIKLFISLDNENLLTVPTAIY